MYTSDANLATLSLNLVTYQTLLAGFLAKAANDNPIMLETL